MAILSFKFMGMIGLESKKLQYERLFLGHREQRAVVLYMIALCYKKLDRRE